jgi:putative addiction module component (TIGR02574 family)
MAQTLETLEAEVLRLSDRDRAKLAKALLLSLEASAEVDTEEEWAMEAERRYDELKQGVVQGIPSEDVFREARSRLK